MFKRISGALSTVIILAVVVVGIANAGVTNLAEVIVTGTTSDNFTVFLPAEFIPAARFSPSYSSIGEWDYSTDLTKAQVCKVLKDHPPRNCTTSNYPASPGIPSASGSQWAGNGCGAGAVSSALASVALEGLYGYLYSGDMNKPVRGNPLIDFTSICNMHDELYTNGSEKYFADQFFDRHLKSLCQAATSDGSTCTSFRNTYVWAVKNHGESAYQADQQQLACSAWGDSMKKSGCA